MPKKLKSFWTMIFNKKEVGDKTTFYLFGIPVFSIEEKLEYDGDKQ